MNDIMPLKYFSPVFIKDTVEHWRDLRVFLNRYNVKNTLNLSKTDPGNTLVPHWHRGGASGKKMVLFPILHLVTVITSPHPDVKQNSTTSF